MAGRCSLFIIIALGKSVIVTTAALGGLHWTAEAIAVSSPLSLAFATTLALVAAAAWETASLRCC
jgi:low temperature requirement protein LtrA